MAGFKNPLEKRAMVLYGCPRSKVILKISQANARKGLRGPKHDVSLSPFGVI